MANEKRLIDAKALMDAFRTYMVERYDIHNPVPLGFRSLLNSRNCEGVG